MRRYNITITGTSPLIMHAHNVAFDDMLKRWLLNPENKKASKAGDDRTPAWRWMGYVCHDAGRIAVPSDNLMTCFREGGAKIPTGKGQATFKRQTQSGILVNEFAWPVLIDGKAVDWKALAKLKDVDDFEQHEAAAAACGFELFVKPVKVQQNKTIRVRPRFENWKLKGSVTVVDDAITDGILEQIMLYAGCQCGLCDWRPSAPKSPGPFGRFDAAIERA